MTLEDHFDSKTIYYTITYRINKTDSRHILPKRISLKDIVSNAIEEKLEKALCRLAEVQDVFRAVIQENYLVIEEKMPVEIAHFNVANMEQKEQAVIEKMNQTEKEISKISLPEILEENFRLYGAKNSYVGQRRV